MLSMTPTHIYIASDAKTCAVALSLLQLEHRLGVAFAELAQRRRLEVDEVVAAVVEVLTRDERGIGNPRDCLGKLRVDDRPVVVVAVLLRIAREKARQLSGDKGNVLRS